MQAIYQFLLAGSILNDAHRNELKAKRGFSTKTIDRFMLRSGGKYLAGLEEEFKKEFSDKDLLDSGLFLKPRTSKTIMMNRKLLSDKIIIPYLDEKGDPYFIKLHKDGLYNFDAQVYQEHNIVKNNGKVVLTEGEFKAMAGMQYGIPTVAVPGIMSFSEVNFPRLARLLHKHKIKKVYILFDNEVKDDPNLKSYVENPSNRYDTYFYAYYMAKKLTEEEKIPAVVAWFPDSWREDGKIDFDGALAQKRDLHSFELILASAKIHQKFLTEQPHEIKAIMLRMNKVKIFRSHIKEEYGHYVATRGKGQNEKDQVISNFTFKIIAKHKTSEGILRDLAFVDEFGRQYGTFTIRGNCMVAVEKFAAFCTDQGDFLWWGRKNDLLLIWERLFLNDDGRVIIEPDHLGYLAEDDLWLFGNIAIKDGKDLKPDKNSVFWLERHGYKPIPLNYKQMTEGMPNLSTQKFDITEVKNKLADTLGDNEAKLCLGWITAVLFLEEVFAKFGCFPFLFVTGSMGSGKSTIGEWLMNFFGLENCGKQASDTTAVAIQRYLGYYSSLPVFIDEYRNTKKVVQKNGFLRNCYNRQSAGKGIKSDFGIREGKVRGTLLICGEEMPEDNALLSRCIGIMVMKKNRRAENFKWFTDNKVRFSYHVVDVLRRKKELVPIFMRILEEAKDYFTDSGADSRTAMNYAVVAAGYQIVFGEDDTSFEEWITSASIIAMREQESEQAISVFLEDLVAMRMQEEIDHRYWDVTSEEIRIYFSGLYNVWSKYYRQTRGIEPFKRSAVLKYMADEPGFVHGSHSCRIGQHVLRCVVFKRFEAPENLRILVGDNVAQEELG